MRKKVERKIASTEATIASMTKEGSKGFKPNKPRFHLIQPSKKKKVDIHEDHAACEMCNRVSNFFFKSLFSVLLLCRSKSALIFRSTILAISALVLKSPCFIF
jgi:hypothetical protein